MAKNKLNIPQEKFCKLYVSSEFYWNWTQSYIEAYNPDQNKINWYKTAKSNASRLLSNNNVCERINELLEEQWLNDQFVDKQLLYLITQHWDISVKMSAIKHYNALKSRVTKKIEHLGSINSDYKLMSTEELLKLRENLRIQELVV